MARSKGVLIFIVNKVVFFYTTFTNILQPRYNTFRYKTVLDITQFKDGSQKCINYIEK